MLYIKRQSTASLDEETLLIWKQASLHYVDKIGILAPLGIFRLLYNRLLNLVTN